ncbi:MAG: cytochrome P450 [Patulibacter sp.]
MSTATSEAPDIFSAEFAADPHPVYQRMRDEFPVYFHEGSKSWLVSRHEDISRILRDKVITNENYSWQIAPVHGHTIINMEGKEHSLHRRLLTPFFHRGGLESFKPSISGVAEELLAGPLAREQAAVDAGTKARGQINLETEYFRLLPISVIARMLDLPKDRLGDFERWYTGIMDFIGNLADLPEPKERGLRAKDEMTEYFLPLIAERRGQGGSDLISLMCDADVNGESLTDEEVRAFISLMITAGGETTDRALGNMFMRLLQHPDQLQAVYDDRSLIADAFAETLRHTPPVHIAGRTPTEDYELHGVTIPAGDTITCMVSAGSRDPRKFEDPDRFDIFRKDNDTSKAYTAAADHLGFANGRHFCVGAMLARAEVEIGANHVLDTMADLQFAEGFEPVENGLFTRGVDELQVTYRPTSAS